MPSQCILVGDRDAGASQYGSRAGGVKVSVDSRVKWIEHNGKRILYADFSGLQGQPGMDVLERVARDAAASPEKVLILYNFQDAAANRAWMSRVKQLGKEVFDAKVEKAAALGVSGIKVILLESYEKFTGRTLKTFKTEAEALEWLTRA